jgi:hypothetical protein
MRRGSTVVALAVLLFGCARDGASLSTGAPARVLFSADDVPAGFEVANVPDPRLPSWCGGPAIELKGAVEAAAEIWTLRPGDGRRATIENIVVRFRPSTIESFLSAVRADETRCAGGVDVTTTDGLHLRGQSTDLALPSLGAGGTAVEAVGGTRVNGAPAGGGWVSRIVLRRRDSVAIVVFGVGGLEYDRGLRDRLAHLAEMQLERMP